MDIAPHSVILFQGNSITDAGRERSAAGPNSAAGLGQGYAGMVARELLDRRAEDRLQFYNRGISGDRILDLKKRWERDTLRLVPDVLNILVGVNDLWYGMSWTSDQVLEHFENTYRELLQLTRERLPGAALILGEPFLLAPDGIGGELREPLSRMQQVVRELAEEFGAHHVPFQTALDEAAEDMPPDDLLSDGVHPTERGHRVLADCWLNHVLEKEDNKPSPD